MAIALIFLQFVASCSDKEQGEASGDLPLKPTGKIRTELDSWLETKFDVKTEATLNFVDFIDYLYARPPLVVGREFDQLKTKRDQITLRKGTYTRRALIDQAKRDFGMDVTIDEKRMVLIFKANGK